MMGNDLGGTSAAGMGFEAGNGGRQQLGLLTGELNAILRQCADHRQELRELRDSLEMLSVKLDLHVAIHRDREQLAATQVQGRRWTVERATQLLQPVLQLILAAIAGWLAASIRR